MTLKDFETLLQSSGFQVSYCGSGDNHTSQDVHICYQVIGSENFFADGQVYYPFTRVQVSLYTPDKDVQSEEKLEAVLSALCWKKTEEYIETNQNYKITYELEV